MKMFSIYDSKGQFYDKPMFLRTKADAIRGWTELANDQKTTIAKHPADFTLFEIGEFNDLTGVVTMYDAKQSIGTALEFVNAKN